MADRPETAFAPHLATLAAGTDAPLLVSERVGLALAAVMARPEKAAALLETMRDRYGLAAVNGARRVASGDRAMIGVGPGNWLFVDDTGEPDAVGTLADGLAGLASVFDQSSGYALLRIEGPRAATLLGKGAFLDLHPAAFPPGSAAVTVIAHIDAILWRLDEITFEVAVFRSLAGSFWHWLVAASAGMGVAPCRSTPSIRRGDENAPG